MCEAMCEEKKTLKERLRSIMTHRKHTQKAIALSVLLLVAVAAVAVALGAAGTEETPERGGDARDAYDTADANPAPATASLTPVDRDGDAISEALWQLGRKWEAAFCGRDGDAIYELCADEALYGQIAYGDEQVGYYDDQGIRRFGMSSSWPWPWGDSKITQRGALIDIIFYWKTSASIQAQRQTLSFVETEAGYRVADVSYVDSAASKADFDALYGYGFPEYKRDDADYATTFQHLADTRSQDKVIYCNPIRSASYLLTVENAEATCEYLPDGNARIMFTWADGNASVIAEQPDVKGPDGIWIVTRHAPDAEE
jgi:hypothetical protein